MEITVLQRDDVEQWVTLRRALWPRAQPVSLSADADRVLASPDEICFLLMHPTLGAVGFIEGAVHYGSEHSYVHVEGWYVAPEFRRKGYGRKLLDHLENWSLHRAICRLTSDTDADYPLSPPAHASSGFRVLSQLTIFIKELQPDMARVPDQSSR